MASVGQQVGQRFHIVSAIPTIALIVFVTALLLAGAPAHAPQFNTATRTLDGLGATTIALLVAVGLVVALTLHPFQFAIVRMLEGYWPPVGPIGVAAERHRERHRARKRVLRTRMSRSAPMTRWEERNNFLVAQRRRHAERRYGRYPDDDRMMPTRLGNALRHAEDFAGGRYNLDAIEVIPRLHPLAPPMAELIADARDQLDITARFVAIWLLATGVGLGLLAVHGPWLTVPLITFALAWISYQGSIAAAEAYGETLVWAMDLYRFELVDQLRFPLPVDHADELMLNQGMMELIRGDRYVLQQQGAQLPPLPSYRHPEVDTYPQDGSTT